MFSFIKKLFKKNLLWHNIKLKKMLINNESYRTIWFDRKKEEVKIIDQTKLPFYLEIVSLNNLEDINL